MQELITKSTGYMFLIIFGYVLKRKGIFLNEDKNVLGKLLMYILLPCAFISNFSGFVKDAAMIYFFFIGLFVNLFMVLAGYLLSLKRNGRDKALYVIECSGYNIGAFTTPFVAAFLPQSAVVMASIYDIGNSIMSVGGVYPIAAGLSDKEGSGKNVTGEFLKKLVSSIPFDTYIIMLIISLMGIHIPKVINNTVGAIGASSIIITMVMIGITFEINVTKEDVSDILKILITRYLAGLVIGLIIWNATGFPMIAKKVVLLCLFAPTTSISPNFCSMCKCKASVYGVVGSLTVPISLIVFMVIMGTL